MKNDKTCAIILAGGIGSRMKSDTTKQRIQLLGISVLRRCVLSFDACPDISQIVVVSRIEELEFAKSELKDIKKLKEVVTGGSSRAESAMLGFKAVDSDVDYIAIHDAARPLIKPDVISKVIAVAKEKGAATAAGSVTDTVKVIDNEGKIISTPMRSTLVRATTPQIFRREIYSKAIDSYSGDLSLITDDNMLVEMLGVPVYTVVSDIPNPKITTKEDICFAELLIKGEKNV